jgi:glycosyltransferase involved in cell wall biosynthesis
MRFVSESIALALCFCFICNGIVKKIILDCDHPQSTNFGLLQYWINLGRSLSELMAEDKKEDIHFFLRPEELHKFPGPLKQIYLKKWHSRYLLPFVWNCDLWHTAASDAAAIPLLLPSTKVLLTIQEWPGEGLKIDSFGKKEKLRHLQSLIDRSDALVCATEHLRQLVKRQMKTQQKEILVITNGTNEVPDVPAYPRGYRPYLPFIFTVGDLEFYKNIHYLLALLADPDVELVIAGRIIDKDYVALIRNLASDKNVSDRVRMIGPITDSDKVWYLRNCKAFALPSLSSSSGSALLEALRFGKPIFLSDQSPLSEIGADVCFYFESFDDRDMYATYVQALKDFTRLHYANRMLSRAREFNWMNQAAVYLRLYRRLLQE